MRATLIQNADEHHWMLLDYRVTQLLIDPGSFRLQSWSLEGSVEIRFGAPFSLISARGGERRLDPEQTEALAPVLALLRRPLQSITVSRDGELAVEFSDGVSLRSAPHPRYEAWEVQGAGALEGMSYQCDVGGGSPWG
jgi:hypothetical protein